MDQSDEGADASGLLISSTTRGSQARAKEVKSCKSTSKFRDALTDEPNNSMESFVMHAVPSEKDGTSSALKRPDDEVQRIEEFDFQPIWQRGASLTSPSVKATSDSKTELDGPSLSHTPFLITPKMITGADERGRALGEAHHGDILHSAKTSTKGEVQSARRKMAKVVIVRSTT